jgi:adenylosuccinate synthase
MISDRAHVIFPWHVAEDRLLNETAVDGENLGTTLRGIGPCYRDKVGRAHAVRLGDMLRPDFRERIARIVESKKALLAGRDGASLDARAIYEEYHGYAERLRFMVADTTQYLLDAVESKKRLLFEGAQGALLDVDHGTFPFVTSSNSSGVGVSAGSGVPGRWIDKVIGVMKTYTTRVGGGPFPTELTDQVGRKIRERGKEYGTTTGRPRRCGWFDAVAVRYTARLSGVDALSAMMLDVLSEQEELKICVAYDIDGRRVEQFPSHVEDLRRARPIYEALPGWREEITGVRNFAELPAPARRYLARISQLVGRPVEIVSVGPDRQQTIFAVRDGPSGH